MAWMASPCLDFRDALHDRFEDAGVSRKGNGFSLINRYFYIQNPENTKKVKRRLKRGVLL